MTNDAMTSQRRFAISSISLVTAMKCLGGSLACHTPHPGPLPVEGRGRRDQGRGLKGCGGLAEPLNPGKVGRGVPTAPFRVWRDMAARWGHRALPRACRRILDLRTLSRTLSKHFADLRPFSTKWTDKVLDKVAKGRVMGQALPSRSMERAGVRGVAAAGRVNSLLR